MVAAGSRVRRLVALFQVAVLATVLHSFFLVYEWRPVFGASIAAEVPFAWFLFDRAQFLTVGSVVFGLLLLWGLLPRRKGYLSSFDAKDEASTAKWIKKTLRISQAICVLEVLVLWFILERRSPVVVSWIETQVPFLSFLLDRMALYALLGAFAAGVIVWALSVRMRKPFTDEEAEIASGRGKSTLRRILGYVRPHWPYAAGVALAIIASSAAELAQPWILGILLIEQTLGNGDVAAANIGLLPLVIGLLVSTYAAKQVASFAKEYLSEVLSQKTVHRLRSDVYYHIERLPMSVLDRVKTGDLVSRTISDTNEVEKVMTEDLAKLISNAVLVVGALALMIYFEPRLGFLVAQVALLLVVVVNVFKRAIKRSSKKIREAIAELTARAFEIVSGLRIVKTFQMERHEAKEFRARSLLQARAKVRLARLAAVYSSSVDLLTMVALVIVVYLAAPAVVQGTMTMGVFVTFLGYMKDMFKPLVHLSKANLTLQKAVAAGDRVFTVLDTAAEPTDTADGLAPSMIEGRITFDRVTFGYRENQNVLDNFSLTIEPGETVAVVGSSGVGKSTVVNLLLRFYEPNVGQVLIDEYPIRQLKFGYLRSQIGLVLQEPVLFSGTVRENIRYGNPRATDEDVVEAAQSANAHDFICALPAGYDTQIGERGASLSVGQRQRIAIARALVKDPRILILDEATSNIDSESESLIQEAMRRLAGRRTMIVIGHRLSSIMDADRIVVLEDGGIAEVGKHEDLIEKGGTYSRLYEAQVDRASEPEATRDEIHDEMM